MTRAIWLIATAAAGCSWSQFDDLGDKTWVKSIQKPNIGSSDYALAIASASTGASGGRLAVVSGDASTLSLLELDATGGVKADTTTLLGNLGIASFGEQPVLTSHDSGAIAVAGSSATAMVIVAGDPASPMATSVNQAAAPDAAVFTSPNTVVVSAASILYVDTAGTITACTPQDPTGAAISGAAALAVEGSTLWLWSKTGAVLAYPLGTLATCGPAATPSVVKATTSIATAAFVPGAGARIHVAGKFLVLAAHADKSISGQVFVVDTVTAQLAGTLAADGLKSSAMAALGGGSTTYLALGFPDAAVGSVQTGEVDLYAFDPTMAMPLAQTATDTLHDAQPDGGEQFGRGLAAISFNGQPIMTVAANSEVFAYYQTLEYVDQRSH